MATTKSSILQMFHWRLIFLRDASSLFRFALTSMTTCIESSKVLFANFILSTGSSKWDTLFWWSIVSLISSFSTSLGTCISSRVGSFRFRCSMVIKRILLSSFSRISRSDLLLHSTNTALFARLLSLLTASFRAFRSTATFISLSASWEDVFVPAYLLTYLLTPWSIVLLEKLTSKLCSYSRISPHLWNPKVPHRTHK